MVLGIILGASNSVSKAFIDLKANLNEEKVCPTRGSN
jgi:hypothetical protein